MQFSVLPTTPHHCRLHAGGLVPLLDVAGLVDDADGLRAGVVGADEVLQPVAHPVLVPVVLAEELLEGPGRRRRPRRRSARRSFGEVGELAGDVDGQMARVSLRGKQSSNSLRNFLSLGLSDRIWGMSMLVSP